MRRLFIFTLALIACVYGKGQNVQLHYDFGSLFYAGDLRDRPQFTSTVEMFKADKWGSSYFFIDMDYNRKGIALAYWEISRELRFWEPPLSAHIEYNGGLTNGGSMNNAYLLGATYTYNNAHFTKGFSFTPMYKYIQKNPNGNFIFLSEPQFWVNLNKIKGVDEKFKLSVGSEVEISHNFAFRDGLYVIPTFAVKWSFD